MPRSPVLSLLLSCLATTASAVAAPRDRDRDRLPDLWEKRYGLSIVKKSATGDRDHDGLRNRREYRLRTNPREKDTDRDGLGDGAEVRRYRTNPRRKDTDGDGYGDRSEIRAGADPRNAGSHPLTGGSNPPVSSTPPPSPTGVPDAASTGVPPGTILAPSGAVTITTASAVIDAREISGQVVVNAPNVTIRRSRIRSNAFRAIENNGTGLVIEDSEIINRPVAGQANCHNGIGWGNYTMRRTDISGCENAADVGGGNVVLEDNYIHDLDTSGPSYVWGNSPHTDGVQGPGSNVVLRRNWIDPSPGSGANAGIMMGIANPVSANYRIEGNYIDGRGASYAIYAPRVQTPGVVIDRNRLLKGYGYTACVRLGVTVQAFNENRDAITGALLSADNGFDGGCSN